MAHISKRMVSLRSAVNPILKHDFLAAVQVLKGLTAVKFKESIDISINLSIDPRKQNVRGSVVLPHGTGRKVRIAVFAPEGQQEAVRAAGADVVGYQDLFDVVKAGNLEADIVLASPECMRLVGQLGQILGPRGLMPNPKDGTVAADLVQAVVQARKGQVRLRNDKGGIIHCTIGKIDFSAEALKENLQAVLHTLRRLKPPAAKGTYFKRIAVSSTMGPGLAVEISSLGGI